MEIITLVCNSRVLHAANAIISAFARLTEETTQTVASADLSHCIRLSLGRHYEQFAPSDNKHDISLENHQPEIEITAINCETLFISLVPRDIYLSTKMMQNK